MHNFKQLLLVSRPVSWLNTAYPFAAGYLVTRGGLDVRFVIGTIFFLIPYNLIMYGVNDVFDYESDIRNPRKGGMEGALAAKRLHAPILYSSAILGIPFVAILIALGNALSGIILLAIMFFVLAYSVPVLRFKERPVLDSITSSIHFVGPLVFALSLTAFTAKAWPAVVAFFLWGMASHAFGAVQDIEPDREASIASVGTFFGAATTVRIALCLYGAAALLLLSYKLPVALYGLVGAVYILNIWPYRNSRDDQSGTTNKAWRRFIYLNLFAGFCMTMLLIYLHVRP